MFTLENLDNVEEADKQFFEESDGKFQFNRSKFEAAAKTGLDTKNRELLGKLAKFKGLDETDIARIAKLKTKAEKLSKFDEWIDAEDLEDDADSDDKNKDKFDQKRFAKQLKADLTKDFDAKLKAKDDELSAERAKFSDYRFDQELTGAALEAGVIGGRLKKFKSAAVAEGIFGYKDGKLVVLDEDGEPSTETVADKFKALAGADDWMFFFEAKEKGGGSGEQKQLGGKGKTLKRSEMSPKEKSDAIKKLGMSAYLKLPE